jgi:hypothetical protein
MSAADVIEQIKKLTPDERQKVEAFLHAPSVPNDATVETPKLKFIPSETFEAAKKKVFAENRELLSRLAK